MTELREISYIQISGDELASSLISTTVGQPEQAVRLAVASRADIRKLRKKTIGHVSVENSRSVF
jgi:hypothetical protein